MGGYANIFKRISASVARSTATLMKTGQTTSYRTGDDGDLERGRGVDFFTLAENNPFGNTNRFTDELGGQTYTNKIVIDWSTYNGSTVLGYSRELQLTGNVTWNQAIDFCLSYNTGGFTNWRLWNMKEWMNVWYAPGTVHFEYAPFSNVVGLAFWTSNTNVNATAQAFVISGTYPGQVTSAAKSGASGRAMAVRDFTVIGTTLT